MLEFLFLYLVYEGVGVRSVVPEGGCVVDSHRVFCHCRRILSPLQMQILKVMIIEKRRRTSSCLMSLKFLQPFKTHHLTQSGSPIAFLLSVTARGRAVPNFVFL